MPTLHPMQRVTFTTTSLVRLLRAGIGAGALSPEGSPAALFKVLPLYSRYRFTTAREIEQSSAACPERNALIDDDGVLSYRQLRDQTRAVATWLLARKRDRGGWKSSVLR